MISAAEATLLMSKFESEERLLSVNFFTKDQSINIWLRARVGAFIEGESLSLTTQNQDTCVILLRECKFEYGDERAAPEFLREEVARTHEGTLRILFPSGESVSLHMLRTDIQ